MRRKTLWFALIFPAAMAACPALPATRLMCGGREVSVFNSNISESPFFVLHVGGLTHIPFSVENEGFALRCERDARGRDRLVILHSCGGSGCADQSNFGIIDPKNGKVLVRPNARHRGNWSKAESVLGKKLKPFECDTPAAPLPSKTSIAESHNGEYCFVSPLELN